MAEQTHRAPTKCPSPPQFAAFFLRELSPDQTEAFLDHVLICDICLSRFNALKDLRSDMREDAGLVSLFGPKADAAPEKSLSRRRPRFSLSGPIWPGIRLPLAAASILLIAAAAVFLLHSNRAGLFRSADPGSLRLLEPRTTVSSAPTRFRWTPLPGDQIDYRLTIADQDLNTIYDQFTKSDSIEIPLDIQEQLQPGIKYVWSVTARSDHGKNLDTASRTLVIK